MIDICRTPMELLTELLRFAPKPILPDPTRLPFVVAKDLRDLPRPKGSRARIIKVRKPESIVGITLHQTATQDFAPNHPGLAEVPAHAMVHRDGTISLLHHPTAYVYHGHALNGGTVGIEIACRAAGVEGDPATFWRSRREILGWHSEVPGWPEAIGRVPNHPGRWHGPKAYDVLVAEATDEQLAATRELVRYYADTFRSIRGIWAHRQGRADRTSDPGSRIWQRVAEPMRVELGLADVRDLTLGDGTPIPRRWRS